MINTKTPNTTAPTKAKCSGCKQNLDLYDTMHWDNIKGRFKCVYCEVMNIDYDLEERS